MHASELSFITLIANASLLVQAVMALLLSISLASWTVIFRKWFQLRDAAAATDRFEADFWKDRDLGALFEQVRDGKRESGSLARIFEAGMAEFIKTRQQKPGDVQAMLKPALRHRLAPNYAAQSQNIGSEQLIDMLLEAVSAERVYERPAA